MISVYVDDNELRILSVEEYHQMDTRSMNRIEDNSEALGQAVEWMLRSSSTTYLVISAQPQKTFQMLNQICKPVDSAGGIVFNGKGELLMIMRLGKWDLPKGKVDPGETFDFTAIREVKEECGLTDIHMDGAAGITYHIFIQNDRRVLKTTYWYYMKTPDVPDLIPQKEEFIEEAKWISIQDIDLDKLVTFETIRGKLRHIQTHYPGPY